MIKHYVYVTRSDRKIIGNELTKESWEKLREGGIQDQRYAIKDTIEEYEQANRTNHFYTELADIIARLIDTWGGKSNCFAWSRERGSGMEYKNEMS